MLMNEEIKSIKIIISKAANIFTRSKHEGWKKTRLEDNTVSIN